MIWALLRELMEEFMISFCLVIFMLCLIGVT